MVPRFVLPTTGSMNQEFEFSIRKEAAPRKEIASVVLSAPTFIEAMRKAHGWAGTYTEKKMSGNDRAFPAVRYAGELYLLKKIMGQHTAEQPFVFVENNERGGWMPARSLEATK